MNERKNFYEQTAMLYTLTADNETQKAIKKVWQPWKLGQLGDSLAFHAHLDTEKENIIISVCYKNNLYWQEWITITAATDYPTIIKKLEKTHEYQQLTEDMQDGIKRIVYSVCYEAGIDRKN